MNRLTDDKTAEGIKLICDGRLAEGVNPETIKSDLRYVKLAEYERQEKKIKRLAERIELILNDIYNTGRMMQDFDYEAIFKCTRELVGQTYNHREPPKEV